LQKRIFVEPFVNLTDPIEIDLLYHQSVTDLFDQKIPLTKADAVRIIIIIIIIIITTTMCMVLSS